MPLQARFTSAVGFTAIYVVVAIGVVAVALATAFVGDFFHARPILRARHRTLLEMQSRRSLQRFVDDIGTATEITALTRSQLTIVCAQSGGPVPVTYAHLPGPGTFVRSAGGQSETLASGVTVFVVTGYDGAGAVAPAAGDVRTVELTFTSVAGDATRDTEVRFTTVSPRLALGFRRAAD